MPPEPFLTSAGWSLNGLVMRGRHFREVPRISISDKNLEMTMRKHETSGVPLVIEGMHEHQAWPTSMFNTQWLRNNSKQQIQVRDVQNRRDLDVSFVEFWEHIKSIHHYASADETSRWYAKDLECPPEWKEWLDTTSLIPRSLCPHGPADIMQNLPERGRVETLMCYLGIGDTFTPCHKDLCASFGHNLMCHTEDGASSFWFMTDSSAAPSMVKYFQSLGQELDLESHTMSVEEFAAAPCKIYITEQRVGDLVLVPPRSCHQVVNHCGLTVKMSWSRMTIRSTQVALHHELPIYRRVCRPETYRIKSTIHHTLRRNTALLEDLAKGKDGSVSFHDVFRRQLANDVQALLELFQEIMLDEYYPDSEILDHVIRDFNHNVYDTEGYPMFSCDFCGSDIFVSFFCCKDCSLSPENPSSISNGLHICPGCYAEGRSCGCGRLMEPVQCFPLQILFADYNRAVRALRGIGVEVFREIEDQLLENNGTGVFEAGTAIQKYIVTHKGTPRCQYCTKAQTPTRNDVTLHCKKCQQDHCFVHLAKAGVHSSEAVTYHKQSLGQGPWHNFHLSRKKTFSSDKDIIQAAEASGDGVSSLIGQKLALVALTFPHCQPLNNIPHVKLGWFDRLKSSAMATSGPSSAMDMSSIPREEGDWGGSPSPLTDIGPEDSVSNALAGPDSPPPRDTKPAAKPRLSGSTTAQSSTAVMTESVKRKRTPVTFDGVVPPGRKRKTNAGYPSTSPSIAHSRPETFVKNDEKSQGSRSPSSLEVSPAQATSRIEALTTTVEEQNRRIGELVQGNTDLRNEIRNLSQMLQLSKRDLQRVENTIAKMTTELKVKFEKMIEKSESRIQGPIDRVLEEVGRMRANPPTPAPMPSVTPTPTSAPFTPEVPSSDGRWTPRDDYNPAELNKHHYQEDYEHHGQPNTKYGRGGFRPFRGRGRGFRGGYLGNRPPIQRFPFPALPEGYEIVRVAGPPSTPATAALEPAPTPAMTPTATTSRHGDAYHSQGAHGRAPSTPQHPPPTPTPSHSSYSSTHVRPYSRAHAHGDAPASPVLVPAPAPAPGPAPSSSSQQRHRYAPGARPQAQASYEHHARDREYERALPSPPPAPPAPVPHPHSYDERIDLRDDERRRAPAAAAAAADDGYRDARDRYAEPYAVRSPAHSEEEQLRWTPTPSDSIGGGSGGGPWRSRSQQHHGHSHSYSRSHSRSRSLSRSPSSGRGYTTGAAAPDDVRGGGWR